MPKRKFVILVEDYNVALTPWCILNEKNFKIDLPKLSANKLKLESLFVFEKDFVTWGPVESQFIKAGDYFGQKLIKDKKFFQQLCRGHYDAFKMMKILCRRLLADNLKMKTNNQLFKIYCGLYDVFAECWKWGLVVQTLDMSRVKFSVNLYQELELKLKKLGNPEIVFSNLVASTKPTAISEENLSVLKFISKTKKNKDLLRQFKNSKNIGELSTDAQNDLKRLAEKFGWLQYYYVGPPAGPEYYLDLVKRRWGIFPDKEIRIKQKRLAELKKFHSKAKSFFTKEEWHQIEIVRELAYLKEIRKEVQVYYHNYAMGRWYQEIASRFYWSPLQARYVTRAEYQDILLKNKKAFTNNQLNERYQCSAHILINGRVGFYTGAKAKEFKKLFVQTKPNIKHSDIIRGQVAYPGKAKGIVKIINSTGDLNKFNEGDILLSYSTNPSLVPAMNKAAAIVTNAGGITCHAAIVSRELGIPCIIGTEVATKVFKDGDVVEVDATKGIIKRNINSQVY
ncbi:MAG: PEP-utilizing enzyme [Patescibacteria group bacterium]|jgi:phosphohistidine swiveling domain-containing protein